MTMSSDDQQVETSLPPMPGPPWQFRLQHLFGLTTLACIAAGLAAAIGPWTLVASAGIVLAWLNLCGAFGSVQSGRAQTWLLWIAWSVFLFSLALPSLNGLGFDFGWQAAHAALLIPYWFVRGWGFWGNGVSPGSAFVTLIVDLANVLALFTPLLIWRLKTGKGARMSAALCLVIPSTWIWWDPRMYVGYYVWCLSFALAQAALPINRWLFAGLVAIVTLFGAIRAFNFL
jgi:hypothetical protein